MVCYTPGYLLFKLYIYTVLQDTLRYIVCGFDDVIVQQLSNMIVHFLRKA